MVWWCKLSGGKPDESSTRSSPYVIPGAMPHSGDRTGLARLKTLACVGPALMLFLPNTTLYTRSVG
jgi:hypothetical protein